MSKLIFFCFNFLSSYMLKLKYKMTEVITTNYLDPIYHDTKRSLFKIYPQSDEIRSNLRIVRYQPITPTSQLFGQRGLYQIFKTITLSTLDRQVLDTSVS